MCVLQLLISLSFHPLAAPLVASLSAGNVVMTGYLKNDKATAEAFDGVSIGAWLYVCSSEMTGGMCVGIRSPPLNQHTFSSDKLPPLASCVLLTTTCLWARLEANVGIKYSLNLNKCRHQRDDRNRRGVRQRFPFVI